MKYLKFHSHKSLAQSLNKNLLKTSSDKYGAVESSLENEKNSKEEEVGRRNEAIRVLRKELDDANELIKTLKHDITTEKMKTLSPNAALVSKVNNSGTRLTQIYSQLLSCQEELANEKREHALLKEHNDEIIADIEKRGPIIKK